MNRAESCMEYGNCSVRTELWITNPDALDASASDLLAVIELDALEALAALQVLQSDVCDQGAVIQLHHLQPLLTTHTAAQVSDPIISYQLTMRETLEHTDTHVNFLSDKY